jgi:hypothetical protein
MGAQLGFTVRLAILENQPANVGSESEREHWVDQTRVSTEARAPRQHGTRLTRYAHKMHLVLAFAMPRLSRTVASPEGTLTARSQASISGLATRGRPAGATGLN